MLWFAILLACFVGLSLGLLGGGGSILTLPVLKYVLGMSAHQAVAVSLFVVGVTSAAALVPHARKGRVRWRTGALFGAAGMAGAFAGSQVARYLPPPALLVAFAAMMFATAFAMLRRRASQARVEACPAVQSRSLIKVVADGLLVGVVTGLVGAGGGFLVVPALVLLGGLPIELAIGTSLLVIAMKSLSGFAGFLAYTEIEWDVALPVAGAAVAGSVAGGALVARLPAAALRAGFGWFVVAMAFFVLTQELPALFGAAPSLLVSLLAPVLGTALLALVARWHGIRKSNAGALPSTAQLKEGNP